MKETQVVEFAPNHQPRLQADPKRYFQQALEQKTKEQKWCSLTDQ